MEERDEKKLILEQYRIYSEAKEKFIDRQFSTNRFYLLVNIAIVVVAYILTIVMPQYNPSIILSVLGITITVMWLMSIDTYQSLIKIKYANVLEYMETKLPEQPYHKEFADYTEFKKKKGLIVFGDMQKILSWIILFIYVSALTVSLLNVVLDKYL